LPSMGLSGFPEGRLGDPLLQGKRVDFLDRYLSKHQVQQQLNSDEFDCYISEPPVQFLHNSDHDLLNWWFKSGPPQL
jgi:hypothetical protein